MNAISIRLLIIAAIVSGSFVVSGIISANTPKTYSLTTEQSGQKYVLDTGLSLGDCYTRMSDTRFSSCELER